MCWHPSPFWAESSSLWLKDGGSPDFRDRWAQLGAPHDLPCIRIHVCECCRVPRCPWATTEPNITYHDEEWGVPVHNDRLLFEFIILEGAQAGLSWTTILKKRENYRKSFDGLRAEKIARYGARDVQRLLRDAGI